PLHDVSDVAGTVVLVGLTPHRLGRRLHADGDDLVLLLGGIDDGDRLGDRARHRLLHVDVLAGVHGVQGHAGVPVVGRGDDDDIDVLLAEDGAVVLADVLLVVLVDAAALGGREQATALAAAQLGVALPDVADGDGDDALLLLLHLQDDVDVLLAAAADAEEADTQVLVGAEDAAVAGGAEGQGGRPGGGRLEEVAAVLSPG